VFEGIVTIFVGKFLQSCRGMGKGRSGGRTPRRSAGARSSHIAEKKPQAVGDPPTWHQNKGARGRKLIRGPRPGRVVCPRVKGGWPPDQNCKSPPAQRAEDRTGALFGSVPHGAAGENRSRGRQRLAIKGTRYFGSVSFDGRPEGRDDS